MSRRNTDARQPELLDNSGGDLLAEPDDAGNGRLPGGTMARQRPIRQNRPNSPTAEQTDDFEDTVEDGELDAGDWEELEAEDPVSEPAALIEEILAARNNPPGTEDGDETDDGHGAAQAAVAAVEIDEDDDPDDPLLAPVRERAEDEFICQGCWLIKRRSQRTGQGDLCRDCD